MGGDVLPRPVRERIYLASPDVGGGVDFETWQAGPCRRLEALAPGEGRVEPGQRARQRANLADLAAAIGIVGPAQPGFVARGEIGRIGRQVDEVEAEPIGEEVAIG